MNAAVSRRRRVGSRDPPQGGEYGLELSAGGSGEAALARRSRRGGALGKADRLADCVGQLDTAGRMVGNRTIAGTVDGQLQ